MQLRNTLQSYQVSEEFEIQHTILKINKFVDVTISPSHAVYALTASPLTENEGIVL